MTPRSKPAAQGKQRKRAGGAPRGNQNAVTHGFYSRSFTPAESELLTAENKKSVEDELKLLRVQIARLNAEISYDPLYYVDDQGRRTRDEHYLHQLNTLTAMLLAVSSLVRTEHLRNPDGGIAQGIMAAIMELNPYEEL